MAESSSDKKCLFFKFGFDYHCQPCSQKGKYLDTRGYCVNCEEYLCRDCYRTHRIPTSSRHHTLLDKHKEGQSHPSAEDILTDTCPVHKEKTLEYYCQCHDIVVCRDCKTLAHFGCNRVHDIHDISQDIQNTHEFQTFNTKMKSISQRSEKILSVSRANKTKRKSNDKAVLNDVRQFREEINAELDELENQIKGEVLNHHTAEIDKLTSVAERARDIKEKVRQIYDKFMDYKTNRQNCHLFRGMKKAFKHLQILEDNLTVMEEENKTELCKFQPRRTIKDIIKTFGSLGKLYNEPKIVRASHVSDIRFTSGASGNDCDIKGAVITDTTLTFTDYGNRMVKVIDTERSKLIAELSVGYPPWEVTEAGQGQFAVTLPAANKIIFLQFWNQALKIIGHIDTKGQCYGIAHKNARLLVTLLDPAQLQILDMQGSILAVIDKDEAGVKLFQQPEHVTVSEYSLPVHIYVSDSKTKMLTCLSQEGKVLAVHEEDNINGPNKIVLSQDGTYYGTVSVCGCNYQNIHLIAGFCDRVQVLLSQNSTLDAHKSLCYCNQSQRLFLQEMLSNTVKVYQITD